jgi:DNA-binding response OmpR family regulator
MKVLIAEDDARTREALVDILEGEGYQVVAAEDGTQALSLFKEHGPDFVCLDIMMPGLDGYQVCRRIREQDAKVPVVFITAKGEEIDTVVGLELGADDYIVKPFGVREVIARIRAVTRRVHSDRQGQDDKPDPTFQIGDLLVSPAELRARRGEQPIELSLRDVKLLRLFAHERGKVLDRNTIMNACWGMNYLPSSRTLDQHISQLRKKVEQDPKDPKIIKTVHGVGYRYEE